MSKCEETNLVPRPFGLVNFKGKEDEVNIKRYLMGNKYATAYGDGLKLL